MAPRINAAPSMSRGMSAKHNGQSERRLYTYPEMVAGMVAGAGAACVGGYLGVRAADDADCNLNHYPDAYRVSASELRRRLRTAENAISNAMLYTDPADGMRSLRANYAKLAPK